MSYRQNRRKVGEELGSPRRSSRCRWRCDLPWIWRLCGSRHGWRATHAGMAGLGAAAEAKRKTERRRLSQPFASPVTTMVSSKMEAVRRNHGDSQHQELPGRALRAVAEARRARAPLLDPRGRLHPGESGRKVEAPVDP